MAHQLLPVFLPWTLQMFGPDSSNWPLGFLRDKLIIQSFPPTE